MKTKQQIEDEVNFEILLNEVKFKRKLLNANTKEEKIFLCNQEIKRLNQIPDFSGNEVVMVNREATN